MKRDVEGKIEYLAFLSDLSSNNCLHDDLIELNMMIMMITMSGL